MPDHVSAKFRRRPIFQPSRAVLVIGNPDEAEAAIAPALAAIGIHSSQVLRVRGITGLNTYRQIAGAICTELGVHVKTTSVFRRVEIAMHALRSAGKSILQFYGVGRNKSKWCQELEDFCILVMKQYGTDVILNCPALRSSALGESDRFLRHTQIVAANILLAGDVRLKLGTC